MIISLIMTITPVYAGEIQININDDVSLNPDDTFSLSASLDFPELQNYTEEIKKQTEKDNLDDLILNENTLNVVVNIKVPKDSLIHSQEWRSEGTEGLKIGPFFDTETIKFRIYKENIKTFRELEETLNQISEIKLYLDNISLQAPTKRQEKLEITGEVNIEYTSVARYEGKVEFSSLEEMNAKIGNYEGYSFENVDDKWVLTYKNEYPIEINTKVETNTASDIGERYSTRTIHVMKDGVEIKTITQKSILKDYEVFYPAYSLEIENEIFEFEEYKGKKQEIEEIVEIKETKEAENEDKDEVLSEETKDGTENTKDKDEVLSEKTEDGAKDTKDNENVIEEVPNEIEEIEPTKEIEEYIIRQYTIDDKALFRKVLTPEETFQYADGYSIEFNDEITYYAIFNEELLTSNEMEFESVDLTPKEEVKEIVTEEVKELPIASEEPKYVHIEELFVDVKVDTSKEKEEDIDALNNEIEPVIEEKNAAVLTEEKSDPVEVVEEAVGPVTQEENVKQMIPVIPVVSETNEVKAPEIVYATRTERVLPTRVREVKEIVNTNDTSKLELYLFLLIINIGLSVGVIWLKNKEYL